MITSNSVQFGDDGTLGTQRFQEIRSAAYEHLLSRIEELGAEFGRWSRSAIQEFVNIEVAGFVRMRRVPVNESALHQIADALTKELAGLGPLDDLLADPAGEDRKSVGEGKRVSGRVDLGGRRNMKKKTRTTRKN